MAKKVVQVEVSEALHDVLVANGELIGVIKTQLKDGFQADKDLPPAIAAALSALTTSVAKFNEAVSEVKDDDVSADIAAVGVAAASIVKKLKG